MVNHKATTILALALLAQPVKARNGDFDPVKTVGIIGGICLGAYAIGKGVQYLCTPSNETLISKARDAQDYAYQRYDSTVRFLASHNYDRSEDTLCELQVHVSGSVQNYLSDMRYALEQVRRASANLSDRMHDLERKGDHYNDYRRMEMIQKDLIHAESTLSRAYEYIDRQSAYSVLYATVDEVYSHYAELLTYVGRYGGNRIALAQYVKEQIAVKAVTNRNPYPLISYAETLNDRITVLISAIQRCHYAPMLLDKANDMADKLKTVRTILLADDRYAFEIQDRERARREEERLRIERARLDAERIKADAAQRQAYAAECQNRELARQNDILREQNRIGRERNERHRYCDYNRCCCNQGSECPIVRIDFVR
jgi:hypothetical protein